MTESVEIENRESKLAIYLIIGLVVSNLTFVGLFIDNRMRYKETQRSVSDWQDLYDQARDDYEDILNDKTSTEDELDQALSDLISAENALLSVQEELDRINYNTDFSGTFYILGQYNQDNNLGTVSIKSSISFSDYFFYRNDLNHASHSRDTYFEVAQVIAGYCRTSTVFDLALYIQANVAHDTDECIINGLLTFCQDRGDFEHCIHYIDDGSDDFSKYPAETLCEGGGDCEDKSILFGSMVRSLGYAVRIAVIEGHVLVVVKLDTAPSIGETWHIEIDGDNYYTCETTSYGFLIGDLPAEIQEESIYTYPISLA